MALLEIALKTTILTMNFHQTKEHTTFLESIGWIVENRTRNKQVVRAFIRKIPGLPLSLMKLQRIYLRDIDWKWVKQLQQKYQVYETDVELEGLSSTPPTTEAGLTERGYTPVQGYMLTTKTRVVDLSLDESALLSAMKPKTRYNIHLAEKRLVPYMWGAGEVARSATLFCDYYSLLQQNARRINMLLLPRSWIHKQLLAFDTHGFVIGVSQKNTSELIAASLFFTSQTTCSYSHNGSTALGRQLMAPSLVIWEGMKEGKRRGLQDFDFDGVYDERYPKQQRRFQGFGRFKAGFGGEEGYFAPMYRQLRWPW